MTALQLALFLLVGLAGTVVVLTRELRRQTLTLQPLWNGDDDSFCRHRVG